MSDLPFLNATKLNKIGPLVKSIPAWEAFLALIEYEESKVLAGLVGVPDHDKLVRVAGKYELLQELKKSQARILAAEKGLKDGPDER